MEKAGDLVQALFDRLGISDGNGYIRFFSSWRRIVGDDLADHSKLIDVRRNAAVVAVDHPGWLQLVKMREQRVLSRMKHEFPELGIETIHFHMVDSRVGDTRKVSPEDSPESDSTTDSESPADRDGTRDFGSGARPPRPSSTEREALERLTDTKLKERLSSLRSAMDQQRKPGE